MKKLTFFVSILQNNWAELPFAFLISINALCSVITSAKLSLWSTEIYTQSCSTS